jgi:ABC-type glycerol-3-phosphate transport system substrate-binding protein
MRALAIILLLISIVFLIVHYKTIKFKEQHTDIEVKYKYIPYGVFDQLQPQNIKGLMTDIFENSINAEIYK